jgi:hypothetical protein
VLANCPRKIGKEINPYLAATIVAYKQKEGRLTTYQGETITAKKLPGFMGNPASANKRAG